MNSQQPQSSLNLNLKIIPKQPVAMQRQPFGTSA